MNKIKASKNRLNKQYMCILHGRKAPENLIFELSLEFVRKNMSLKQKKEPENNFGLFVIL